MVFIYCETHLQVKSTTNRVFYSFIKIKVLIAYVDEGLADI